MRNRSQKNLKHVRLEDFRIAINHSNKRERRRLGKEKSKKNNDDWKKRRIRNTKS